MAFDGPARRRRQRQVGRLGAPAIADVTAAWALAHRIADLLNTGRLRYLLQLGRAERDAVIAGILRRWATTVDRPAGAAVEA